MQRQKKKIKEEVDRAMMEMEIAMQGTGGDWFGRQSDNQISPRDEDEDHQWDESENELKKLLDLKKVWFKGMQIFYQ